jgi:hypothetical protein
VQSARVRESRNSAERPVAPPLAAFLSRVAAARPHPPRPVYRAYLAQSQVFVGIYWQSYGWVAPGEDISGNGGSARPTLLAMAELE